MLSAKYSKIHTKKIISESASWNKLNSILWHLNFLLIFCSIFIWSADYFLSYAHPKRKHPWSWVNISEFVLEKGPTLGSKIGSFFWSLVYPKCSKLEVYNPWVMILEMFSIIFESNDPQIFHLQNKLWLYKLFVRLGACCGYLVTCPQAKWNLCYSALIANFCEGLNPRRPIMFE